MSYIPTNSMLCAKKTIVTGCGYVYMEIHLYLIKVVRLDWWNLLYTELMP